MTANYWWILPSLIFTILALLIRAYRWKFFFTKYNQISFSSLWRSVCIGYMANNVLPFRIGEIVRAWFFAQRENRKTSEVFGTIVLERIFDILSILILYVIFVFSFSNLPPWMVWGAWVMAAIALFALGSLIALKFWTTITRKIIDIVLKPFSKTIAKKINHMVDSFIEGL